MDGDRDHQSSGVYVPVIRLIRHFPTDASPWRELVADEVVMAAFQAQDERHPTITMGISEDSRICLELREESATRVAAELLALLALLGQR